MRRLLLPFLLISSLHAADRPLIEAAREAALNLPAGGIACAEFKDGKAELATFPSPQDKKEDYTDKTLFEIGSITKVFTGLLLAQAVVENKVTLDTTVASLLPKSTRFADPRVGQITLKQLSTHTSGLPRLPTNHEAGVKGDDPYVGYDEKLMIEFLTTTTLEGTGPYEVSYSNYGVGLLGHLLGKVYKTSWEKAVMTKICEPLGLANTRMTVTGNRALVATPYDGKKRVSSWNFDAVAGAGALRSNIGDVLRFGQALASAQNTPLAAAMALAMQKQASTADGGIGLGLFMSTLDGDAVYSHNGGTGGYRTTLQVIPAKKIVRVVLINNAAAEPGAVVAKTRVDGPRVMPQETELPATTMQEYPGVYALDKDTRFTVLLRNNQKEIWIRLTGQAFLRAFAKENDRFFYKAVNAEVSFNRTDGKVTSLTLHQNGRDLTARKTDEPEPKIILSPADKLKPYVGTYSLAGLRKMVVELRARTLFVKLDEQPFVPVFNMGNDRFEYDVVVAALTFTRNEKGEITGLTISQNGSVLPAAKVN